MTEAQTLLEQAARCRRIARICTTAGIARKFEALAKDYEEHAWQLRGLSGYGGDQPLLELREPRAGKLKAGDAAETLEPHQAVAR